MGPARIVVVILARRSPGGYMAKLRWRRRRNAPATISFNGILDSLFDNDSTVLNAKWSSP